MPELPDLLHIQAKLEERLRGRKVTAERLTSPVILRCLVRGNLSLLLGRTRAGMAMRAVVDNPTLLAYHGTGPDRTRRLAWMVGAAFDLQYAGSDYRFLGASVEVGWMSY